jgi:pyridoxamine 5'-phosphate oxidase
VPFSDDPVTLFQDWLRQAETAELPEPLAVVLATADTRGRPSARVVLHRRVEDGRWLFAATSRHSRKGRELAANPYAALVFHWREQHRQVRVSGRVRELGTAGSAEDFQGRSPASRAEALAARPETVLHDPADLDAALREAAARLEAEPDLVAPDWTLYALEPDEVELLELAADRRHLRLRYTRSEKGWRRERLWP